MESLSRADNPQQNAWISWLLREIGSNPSDFGAAQRRQRSKQLPWRGLRRARSLVARRQWRRRPNESGRARRRTFSAFNTFNAAHSARAACVVVYCGRRGAAVDVNYNYSTKWMLKGARAINAQNRDTGTAWRRRQNDGYLLYIVSATREHNLNSTPPNLT